MQEGGGVDDAGGYALWSAMAKETDSLTRQLALLSGDPKYKVNHSHCCFVSVTCVCDSELYSCVHDLCVSGVCIPICPCFFWCVSVSSAPMSMFCAFVSVSPLLFACVSVYFLSLVVFL